jgi:hypothetical protein
MATVITIVNYNRTVMMIINYDPKTFIVQATGVIVADQSKSLLPMSSLQSWDLSVG